MAEMIEDMPATCPACRRPLASGRATYGWRPCGCDGAEKTGGHRTVRCEQVGGGCGHVVLVGHVGAEEQPDRLPNFGQASEPAEREVLRQPREQQQHRQP